MLCPPRNSRFVPHKRRFDVHLSVRSAHLLPGLFGEADREFACAWLHKPAIIAYTILSHPASA
jgi:hypothetical protein